MKSAVIHKLGIISAGIMGEALLASIIKSWIDASDIAISDTRSEQTTELAVKCGCMVFSAEKIASNLQNILLVVKPQAMNSLVESVGESISVGQGVVFLAADKTTSSIEKYLMRVLRCSRLCRIHP